MNKEKCSILEMDIENMYKEREESGKELEIKRKEREERRNLEIEKFKLIIEVIWSDK